MQGPSPDDPNPMMGFPQVGFLKPLVKNPNIPVGGGERRTGLFGRWRQSGQGHQAAVSR